MLTDIQRSIKAFSVKRPAAIFAKWLVAIPLCLSAAGAFAQDAYPSRPIRLFAAEPGGAADVLARIVAAGLTNNLHQQVIVENRVSGPTLTDPVLKSEPNGYTLLIYNNNLWIQPFLEEKPSYDSARDFAPIIPVAGSPFVLLTNLSLPATSVKELIALAKAKPGELNFASSGPGTATHLAAVSFSVMSGISMTHIPYKGVGPALNDLAAGRVQLMFLGAGTAWQQVKSGKVRGLAVSTPDPSDLAPGLPTVGATVPGYSLTQVSGLFAPGKTPTAIISRLNQEVMRVLTQPDVKQKIGALGVDIMGGPPDKFAALIKAESVTMGKLIKDQGIRTQ